MAMYALLTASATTTGSVDPSIYQKIDQYSAFYQIDEADFAATLECESGLDPEAVGDHGTSLGIAQIHLPAHPDITKEEALDPDFALDWAAKQFSLGHQTMWTCWRERHE